MTINKIRRGQDKKLKVFSLKKKKTKAQEEMIGFALIIILVSVILLAFLGFSLNKSKSEGIPSYEVDNFLQAFLQYTTDCKDYKKYFTIQDLIFECERNPNNKCLNEEETTCEVLNSTLKGILDESWNVSEQSFYKRYELIIYLDDDDPKQIIDPIVKGNSTGSYKSGFQEFTKTRPKRDFIINFKVYS